MKTWFEPGELEIEIVGADETRPLIALMYAVADERGWTVERHLDDYLEHSVFFAARRGDELLGGIKLVLGNPDGLPVNEGWPETNLVGRTDVADLSLLAMRREDRGNFFVMGSLCAAMWRYCLDHGVRELWAELPVRNFGIYRRFGFPFEKMGEPRIYWGGPGVPARIIVDAEHNVFAERTRESAIYEAAIGARF